MPERGLVGDFRRGRDIEKIGPGLANFDYDKALAILALAEKTVSAWIIKLLRWID